MDERTPSWPRREVLDKLFSTATGLLEVGSSEIRTHAKRLCWHIYNATRGAGSWERLLRRLPSENKVQQTPDGEDIEEQGHAPLGDRRTGLDKSSGAARLCHCPGPIAAVQPGVTSPLETASPSFSATRPLRCMNPAEVSRAHTRPRRALGPTNHQGRSWATQSGHFGPRKAPDGAPRGARRAPPPPRAEVAGAYWPAAAELERATAARQEEARARDGRGGGGDDDHDFLRWRRGLAGLLFCPRSARARAGVGPRRSAAAGGRGRAVVGCTHERRGVCDLTVALSSSKLPHPSPPLPLSQHFAREMRLWRLSIYTLARGCWHPPRYKYAWLLATPLSREAPLDGDRQARARDGLEAYT
eukprot:scaffold603_cov404-Prasinococcus_capsulatus_cf.AAC.31